jgi:diguanylate cyclase (GGDEF)-like protein
MSGSETQVRQRLFGRFKFSGEIIPKRSSIRRKTVLIILITTFAMTLVIALASIFILLSSYTRLEANILRNNLHTAAALLEDDTKSLEQAAADLASDEGIYTFLQGISPNFVPDERIEKGFTNQDIGLVALVAANGEVLFLQHSAELATSESRATLTHYLNAHPHLLQHPGPAQVIISLDRTWLAASHPVTSGSAVGPAAGILIIGRALEETRAFHLAEDSRGHLGAMDYSGPDLPAALSAARQTLASPGASFIHPINTNRIIGYTLLTEPSGDPSILLSLEDNRDIYSTGRVSMLLFILTTVLTGQFFALIVSRTLDREVISRLEELAGSIRKIREENDFSMRVQFKGNDELSHLAGGINDTIEALESSTLALKDNQERLTHEATHDALTGFPNRLFFSQRLNQALALLEAGQSEQVALLFVDLDGFKLINDSYDHQFGDLILIAFGERLKRCLRSHDFVARLGGDEFAILLENVRPPEESARVAQRILDDVRRPFEVEGRSLFLTASIGIASTTHVQRSEELLRNADMAMYTAKAQGKACFAIFDEQMHNLALERLNLENDLRRAIEREEFIIYYQPIVSMFDGQVTTVEALIRWNHPERGLLLPDAFINVAKETGLLNQMNKTLFHQSFSQLREWREQGMTNLRLALNISVRVLPEKHFWDLFERELQEAGVPPTAIQIEVVESEMAASIDQTMEALQRLQDMGVTISVDDFGTGYSSLAYLKRLPIHSLKIDRTFIKDVNNDRDDAAIVSAMIVMAHVLELDVVAEGVETESQFRFLLDQSCEKAQGYLLSHPEPPETITRLLLSGKALLPDGEL